MYFFQVLSNLTVLLLHFLNRFYNICFLICQNEEALKKSIDEYKNLLQRQERKYLALKKHAEDQLLK